MSAIKHVHCLSAEELLDMLSNKSPLWDGTRRFWVFRGLRDDRYKLLPSALRPEAKLGFTHVPKGIQLNNKDQIRAEFDRLQEFFWSVDAQGLAIPTDGTLLRTPSAFNYLHKEIEEQWPCDTLLPLLALAQHYGVCTRLLDWTENPLVATHFAAIRHLESLKRSSKDVLCIWALNLEWVIHDGFPAGKAKMAVYAITAPRASNPNLHAQSGVFTTELLDQKDQQRKGKLNTQTVDEIVDQCWKKLNWNKHVMVRMTLPCREAPKLLRLLFKEGIDVATLFPGYQGVADAMKEKNHWDKPEASSYWFGG